MRRALRLISVGALALAALLVAAAGVLDMAFSTRVQIIAPHSPEVVALNRSLWLSGDPVTEIYGVAAGEPVDIVFAVEERLLRPAEEESLLLYPVDRRKGEHPLQVKTVWFVATRAMVPLAFLALLAPLLALGRRFGILSRSAS